MNTCEHFWERENIILCGFMGCGKTTLGRLLAARLGRSFVDLDDLIVQQAGMSIPDLFRTYGEAGFRDREHNAIRELSGWESAPIVLATGGGALTVGRNVELLRQSGIIVYLNPGFGPCYQRICASDRPLVRANSREQLEEMYLQRDRQYRAAAHIELTLPDGKQKRAAALEKMVREFSGSK